MKNCLIARGVMLGMAALFVLGGCAAIPPTQVAAPARDDAFTFVVMGDNRPHASSQDRYAQPPDFVRAIAETNILDPDLVVIVGDLILGYTEDEAELTRMWDGFDTAVTKFKVPYYQVIGNHDVSNAVMQRVYLDRYGSRFPPFYSFDHKACHFIVLNSDLHGEYKQIIGEQLKWLKQDLERHRRASKIFAFLHQPLWKYPDSNWMRDVHPLLAEYGVDTVFCGHWHVYTKHADVDGVRYIVTGGAGAEIGRCEVTGSFYHYCLVTVRGEYVPIAVVRTGQIENEDVVNEEVLAKATRVIEDLRPTGLRVERGATELPDQLHFVVNNPFDQDLTGTLRWHIPKGSPWKLPAGDMAISVEPGKQQRLTIQVPKGGSVRNTRPIEPFPTGTWNLFVGARALLVNATEKLTIDRWPYSATRARLRRAFSIGSLKRVVTGSNVSTALRIRRKNVIQWPAHETLSWRLPEGCRWKVSPGSAELALAPNATGEAKFQVSFAGRANEIFPLPRLDSLVKVDGEKALTLSQRLPIRHSSETMEAFSENPPVIRCVRVKTGPAVNGVLDDTLWAQCPVASNLLILGARGRADFRTDARFAYDDTNLYACFRCHEPNLHALVLRAKKRDGAVWADDCVEMFLDTNQDKKTYYHYVFNANAVIYDADSSPSDCSWNGPCVVKAGRESKAWTLEVAIPWKSIGMTPPRPGTRIGLEVGRTRRQRPRETSQWSPTFAGHHVPERYGVLVFE